MASGETSRVDSFGATKVDSNVGESSTTQTINGKSGDTNTPDFPDASADRKEKPNWLVQWIQTQIKTFSPPFLIMATKCFLFDLLTVRGSLPPVIFLAMYRATPVANTFGSLGYLITIISSLSFAMQPRAVFLEGLIRNLLFTCLAVPLTILGLWCARQAKLHTQPAGSTQLYNSSAAAVAGIFLFFNVFAVNAFRAVLPLVIADIASPQVNALCCDVQHFDKRLFYTGISTA
jgi:hypothetical protein